MGLGLFVIALIQSKMPESDQTLGNLEMQIAEHLSSSRERDLKEPLRFLVSPERRVSVSDSAHDRDLKLGLACQIQLDAIHRLVLSHSPEAVTYVAQGTVRVRRPGLAFVVTLPLGPSRATLRADESVSFEVTFTD